MNPIMKPQSNMKVRFGPRPGSDPATPSARRTKKNLSLTFFFPDAQKVPRPVPVSRWFRGCSPAPGVMSLCADAQHRSGAGGQCRCRVHRCWYFKRLREAPGPGPACRVQTVFNTHWGAKPGAVVGKTSPSAGPEAKIIAHEKTRAHLGKRINITLQDEDRELQQAACPQRPHSETVTFFFFFFFSGDQEGTPTSPGNMKPDRVGPPAFEAPTKPTATYLM